MEDATFQEALCLKQEEMKQGFLTEASRCAKLHFMDNMSATDAVAWIEDERKRDAMYRYLMFVNITARLNTFDQNTKGDPMLEELTAFIYRLISEYPINKQGEVKHHD